MCKTLQNCSSTNDRETMADQFNSGELAGLCHRVTPEWGHLDQRSGGGFELRWTARPRLVIGERKIETADFLDPFNLAHVSDGKAFQCWEDDLLDSKIDPRRRNVVLGIVQRRGLGVVQHQVMQRQLI